MSFVLNPQIVPSGGAILLSITSLASAGYGGMTIDRSADNGVTWTNLYNGQFTQLYLDVGDKLPKALDTATSYKYRVIDTTTPSVSAVTSGTVPVSQLTLLPDFTTEVWRRLIQSGIASLVIPDGMTKPQVLFQMPLDSTPKLPFIVMNRDLIQQEEIPIGFSQGYEQAFAESVAASGNGIWTVQGIQNVHYSIHVLTKTFQERDYYEQALLGILYGLQTTLIPLNQQIRFSYQATQGAIEADEAQPGFYYSQVMLTLSNIGMVQISAQVGVLNGIGITAQSGNTATATISGSGLFVSA